MRGRGGPWSLVRPGILSLAIAAGAPAAGVPMPPTQAEIDDQLAGLAVVLESLDGVAVSDYPPPPFGIVNGLFSSPTPRVEESPELCDSMAYCLNPASIIGSQTFAALPAGAQSWGAGIVQVDATAKLPVTVTGAAESLEMVISGSGLLGFDREGPLSVAFQNLRGQAGSVATGDYTGNKGGTGAVILVTLSGLTLLGLAVAAVWALKRQLAL
jgi:hypothetical protein